MLKSFLGTCISTHVEEMHKLLVVSVEFLDLGMIKIEAEHPVPDFDNLLTRSRSKNDYTFKTGASLAL